MKCAECYCNVGHGRKCSVRKAVAQRDRRIEDVVRVIRAWEYERLSGLIGEHATAYVDAERATPPGAREAAS